MSVKPKKYLGQHFLKDENIAKKIADAHLFENVNKVLEIGPGMGVLTKFLLQRTDEVYVIEIDTESVEYLRSHFPGLIGRIIEKDFLKFDLKHTFEGEQIAISGNFPYNISSQIVFRMLEFKHYVPEFCGMFQKEVAERICSSEGSKIYGILSVLVQAFYETEYLFTVPPSVFNPPPKVQSGVIRLIRKENNDLGCDELMFKKVVKLAFNQRRKTLRNSLKTLQLSDKLKANVIFGMRPEQLNINGFKELVSLIESDQK